MLTDRDLDLLAPKLATLAYPASLYVADYEIHRAAVGHYILYRQSRRETVGNGQTVTEILAVLRATEDRRQG